MLQKLYLPLTIAFSATLLLILMHFGRNFCFLADDFYYLAKVYHPTKEFSLVSFHTYLSRMPLGAIPIWLMFQQKFINDTHWFFIYVMFFVHALSCSLLTQILARKLLQKNISSVFLALVCVGTVFFPNTYEVVYWPTTLTYILGGLLLVLSFYCRWPPLQFVVLTASYLNSEMFLLPALAILLCPQIKSFDYIEALRKFSFWILTVMFFLAIRFFLSRYFGSPPNRIHLEPNLLYANFLSLWEQTFFLHFHKIYYPISIFFLLAIFVAIGVALKNKWLKPYRLLMVILLILGSGAIVLPLNYGASRALYGAQVFFIALGSVGILGLIQKHRRIGFALTGLLFLLFFIQQQMILNIKHHNNQIVQEKIALLQQEIQSCSEPCQIALRDLDAGFFRDWVLHPDYWGDFAQYVKNKYFPTRKVTFTREQ